MTRRRLLGRLAFAMAYAALATISMRQRDAVTLSTLYWPPAGLLMAVLMLRPPHRWPTWMVLAATLHTSLGVLVGHRSISIALIFAGADLLFCGVVAGAWRACCRDVRGLDTLRGALWFVGLLMGGCIAGGILVALALRIAQPGVSPAHWYVWSLAAFVGCMVATPLVTAWSTLRLRRLADQNLLHLWIGLIASFALLLGTTVVFDDPPRTTRIVWHDGFGMSYGPLLFLSVVALCWGAAGSTVIVAGLALIAGSYTTSGMGPFANIAHFVGEPLLAVQGYLGTAALLGLVTAALVSDRERALRRAVDLKAQLEAALRIGGHMAWEYRPGENRLRLLGRFPFPLDLPGDAALQAWVDRVHPDEREDLKAWFERSVHAYAPRPLPFRLRGDDGQYYPVEIKSSSLAGDDDPHDRMAGLLDVSRATGL